MKSSPAYLNVFAVDVMANSISAWTPPYFEILRLTKHGEDEGQSIGPWQVRPTQRAREGRFAFATYQQGVAWNAEYFGLVRDHINAYVGHIRAFWQKTQYDAMPVLRKMVDRAVQTRTGLFMINTELSTNETYIGQISPDAVLYFHCDGEGTDAESLFVKAMAMEAASTLDGFIQEKLAAEIATRDVAMQRILNMLELP